MHVFSFHAEIVSGLLIILGSLVSTKSLKKRSSSDKLVTTTKWVARETVLKEQVKSATQDKIDYRREAKTLNTRMRNRVKDLAKTSDLLKKSQRKLS
jgi:hypothetical protein